VEIISSARIHQGRNNGSAIEKTGCTQDERNPKNESVECQLRRRTGQHHYKYIGNNYIA